MLELVRNARIAFQTYLDKQKETEKHVADHKRKTDHQEFEGTHQYSAEISEIERELQNEQHRLQAAKNIVSSGREKLDAAISSNTFSKSKAELAEAKSLIDFGTEKSEICEAKIKKLESKRSALEQDKIKKLEKKNKRNK